MQQANKQRCYATRSRSNEHNNRVIVGNDVFYSVRAKELFLNFGLELDKMQERKGIKKKVGEVTSTKVYTASDESAR
jgi:hypothetical protein